MYSQYISTEDLMLTRTSVPEQILSLEEVKANLKVQYSAEDDFIVSLINTAQDYLDVPNGVLGRSLLTQTWEYCLQCPNEKGHLVLPMSPIQGVTNITYFDLTESEVSLDISDFYLYKNLDFAYLVPKKGNRWPSTFDRLDAIKVTFVCGFGSPSEIPVTVRQLAQLLIAHWFENRNPIIMGQTPYELPISIQNLINLNKKGWVA